MYHFLLTFLQLAISLHFPEYPSPCLKATKAPVTAGSAVSSVREHSQVKEVSQSWGGHTEEQQCHSDWLPAQWTGQCCHPVKKQHESDEEIMNLGEKDRKEEEYYMLTLSVRVASQPGTDSSWRTMSTWPCSQAHISAVEPSSSRMLTCAPQDSSARTMSPRPWLTASISAVWPAYEHTLFQLFKLVFNMWSWVTTKLPRVASVLSGDKLCRKHSVLYSGPSFITGVMFWK